MINKNNVYILEYSNNYNKENNYKSNSKKIKNGEVVAFQRTKVTAIRCKDKK